MRLPKRVLKRSGYALLTVFLTCFVYFLFYDDSDWRYVANWRPRLQQVIPSALPNVTLAPCSTSAKIPTYFKSTTKKSFVIHIWQQGERMKRRFLRSYGKVRRDAYALCSVRNCRLSIRDDHVHTADAVLFHLHQTKGPDTLPRHHPPDQLWIFFTDESPYHTFLASRKYVMRDYDGLFNWSMTYRHDADVPVPYGRTEAISICDKELYMPKNYFKAKSKGIAILGSNCGGQNYRWDYVWELQKHVDVDIYGGCGNRTCPGHFTRDCPLIADYKFYLAFENSDCTEYMTEKLWWNAYHKETVPVVMGPPKRDYERLCPPNSFVHVADFESPTELAKYLKFLMTNETAYNSYFAWKHEFKVLNEHGYFGSPSLHLCRICEALNKHHQNPVSKTYDDLASYWDRKTDCYKPVYKPTDKIL